MTFYLGTHMPLWLFQESFAPLFVSRRTLCRVENLKPARCEWALDSGGFSELSLHGAWTIGADQYTDEVRKWRRMGGLAFAAQQDYMCEPFIVRKTGLSVDTHQSLTVENFCDLTRRAPEIPWLPVIQGYTRSEYMACVRRFDDAGIKLTEYARVGVGSVCRRQGTREAEEIIRELTRSGISVHAFGFKLAGLESVGSILGSADSMAWSFGARRAAPMVGCAHLHKSCANCKRYAKRWYERVMEVLHGNAEIMESI